MIIRWEMRVSEQTDPNILYLSLKGYYVSYVVRICSQHINRVQVHGLFLFRYHISIGVTTNTECEYGNVRNRKDVLTENGSRNRY